LLFLPLFTYAQTKKPTVKATTKTTTTVNPEEKVKINAEKWFKEFYVENNFNDPYSYKLLKLTSEKFTKQQDLTDSIAYLTAEIEKCKLSESDRNPKTRQQYQDGYDKTALEKKKTEEWLKTEKDAIQIEGLKKRMALIEKYALIYLDGMKEYDLYVLNSDEKKRIQEKLSSISPEQATELAYYRIKIDCYSKNSLGNEVLGRFQFPFTEKGPIGTGDGTSTVIQLNKE
jgi:hypothetical protein